jgi:hypothetical protein
MTATTGADDQSKLRKAIRVAYTLAIATLCGLTFGFTLIGFFYSMLVDSVVGARDFVVYWATGQQLAHHANPYDRVALLHIERAAGLPDRYGPMFMRNPPNTLLLAYPLGFLPLKAASVVWPTALCLCLVVSVYILWRMFGKRGGHRHWLGYSFAPALICLINGQAALFSLLGLVVFLRLHRSHPFLAGLSLWLCTTKPHLFLPFGLVMLIWIVVTRSYRLLLGSLVAIALSFAITSHIDPLAWQQYSQMVRTSGIEHEFIPCFSVLVRVWIHPDALWLQYVPAVLACIWAVFYYWRRRTQWNWMTNGSLLMLVSIVAAPYSWLFDQGLAIPALLQGAYFTRSRNLVILLAILSALVEVAMFCNIWKPSAMYLWTMWAAPAWLIWYLLAVHSNEWRHGWRFWRILPWSRGSEAAPELPRGSAGRDSTPAAVLVEPGNSGEEIQSA